MRFLIDRAGLELTWGDGLKAINPKLVDAPPPPCRCGDRAAKMLRRAQ